MQIIYKLDNIYTLNMYITILIYILTLIINIITIGTKYINYFI